MRVRLSIFLSLSIGIAAIALFAINYVVSRETLVVDFQNVHSVEIYDTTDAIEDGDQTRVAQVSTSGEKIRLKKGFSYSLIYEGDAGFDSGKIDFRVPGEKKRITIDPQFSEDRLKTILEGEFTQIKNTFDVKYKKSPDFEVQKGKLYAQGDWYGTTLKYRGGDLFNADTLRMVMKKENGIWVIKTDPPNISLSRFIYPDIPEYILRDVNKL